MRLNEIYERYKDVVRFICVYIKEAHPDDGVGGYRSDYNIDRGIAFDQPKTEDERAAVARHCLLRLDLRMPMLLDDMTNQVDTAYCALPERLYVIDAQGVISYRSEVGPWGFDVEAFERAVQEQVSG